MPCPCPTRVRGALNSEAIVAAGALSVTILLPPESKPEKWDAADAVAEGFDCKAFIADGPRATIKAAPATLPVFSLGAMLDDDSPIPPDIVSPRVLTPAGMLVFGGAPKVGKSDFLLSWLAHMAAGAAFLGMRPARPLRVFYLQAEVQYHYLRERMRDIRLPASRMLPLGGLRRSSLILLSPDKTARRNPVRQLLPVTLLNYLSLLAPTEC